VAGRERVARREQCSNFASRVLLERVQCQPDERRPVTAAPSLIEQRLSNIVLYPATASGGLKSASPAAAAVWGRELALCARG